MRKSSDPKRHTRARASELKAPKGVRLDQTDLRILSILQEDARVSNAEIARRVGMVPSGILERLRKLAQSKVILGYETRLDSQALGSGLLAFIFVKADERDRSLNTAVELAKIPEVQEVHSISGEDCYLVKIRVANPQELGHILRNKMRTITSVLSTRSTIVLDTVKETIAIPLPKRARRP